MIKVVKFGGSSLASAAQFEKVKRIIEADKTRRYVVPSAPGKRCSEDEKVTDLLYAYYDAVILKKDGRELRRKIEDRFIEILKGLHLFLDLDSEFDKMEENFRQGYGREYAASRGEYLNGKIMSAYLKVPFVDAAEGICFNEQGEFLPEETNLLLYKKLKDLKRAVIPGFYGSMPDGKIRTFSRGGSDITGSLVARAVKADLYENWTDVSGFLLADPRIVKNPAPISMITYKELYELSSMGAAVLHEDAVFPVKKEGIPIQIKNTNHPEDEGTRIVSCVETDSCEQITGIAGKKGFCAVHIEQSISSTNKILKIFEKNKVSFEAFPTERDQLSFLLEQKEFQEKEGLILSDIQKIVKPDQLSVEQDLALVAVGARGHQFRQKMEAGVLDALVHASIGVKTLKNEAKKRSVLMEVPGKDFELAVQTIYKIYSQIEKQSLGS